MLRPVLARPQSSPRCGTPASCIPRVLRVALVVLVLAADAAVGQTPEPDRIAAIDALFDWATPSTPGCAVAVAHQGEVVVNRAYGSADLERGLSLTPHTVFDVGSLTKQFVAAAVLLLVEDGRIALDDDVRGFIPELPDPGHTITVDHLLTHTSGVRDWVPLLQLAREPADALALILRQRGLNFAPGEEWSYSNSGYVLLKELIARVSGMPFSDFARLRLFEPLGMAATTYAEDVLEGPDRLALAYERDGDRWAEDRLTGNARGGGGALLSTTGDLLLWNEALSNGRLGPFVTTTLQEPARLNNGRTLGYARGLFLDLKRGNRMVWHTGSAGGYKSLLSRLPEQDLSIAILCNGGDSSDGRRFAPPIVDLFVSAPAPSDPAPGASSARPEEDDVDGIDVTGRTGLFFSTRTGEPLRLVEQHGGLQILGGPSLVAVADDRFRNPEGLLSVLSEDTFTLRFTAPDAFELVSMEGEVTRYRRARPYAPTAAERGAFAGRYESDELRATLELVPTDDGLTVHLNGSRPFALEPVDTDTFQLGRMILRFQRDDQGRVAGLAYSNPVLRAIVFTRLDHATLGP